MGKKNKAVLITGASGRLGLLLARTLLTHEYSVILHYRTSPEPAKKTISSMKKPRGEAYFIQGSLDSDPESLINQALDIKGIELVGLINSASEFTKGNFTNPNHLESIFKTNVFAPVRLTQRLFETMGKGWVVNITDAHIQHPNENFQNYRVSKQMLKMITEQQAFLYAPKMRINAIAPGAMLPAKNRDTQYFKDLANEIPLKRTGDLGSFTNAFEFLLYNEYITGQTIYVDGGWHLL